MLNVMLLSHDPTKVVDAKNAMRPVTMMIGIIHKMIPYQVPLVTPGIKILQMPFLQSFQNGPINGIRKM